MDGDTPMACNSGVHASQILATMCFISQLHTAAMRSFHPGQDGSEVAAPVIPLFPLIKQPQTGYRESTDSRTRCLVLCGSSDAHAGCCPGMRLQQPDILAARTSSQHHTLRHTKLHLAWLEIGDHDSQLADQLLRRIG